MPDVSEQAMEKAVEAAQTAVFTAIGGSRQPDASTAWAIAKRCLEAALSVLIESGELVAGEEVETLKRSRDGAWEWEEAAHRSRDRLLAERDALIAAIGEKRSRAVLARLGSEAGK